MRSRRHSRGTRRRESPLGATPDWQRWSSWSSVPGPAAALPTATVGNDLCTGCGQCLSVCPAGAISLSSDGKAVVDASLCRGCGACAQICPVGAVHMSAPTRPDDR